MEQVTFVDAVVPVLLALRRGLMLIVKEMDQSFMIWYRNVYAPSRKLGGGTPA